MAIIFHFKCTLKCCLQFLFNLDQIFVAWQWVKEQDPDVLVCKNPNRIESKLYVIVYSINTLWNPGRMYSFEKHKPHRI